MRSILDKFYQGCGAFAALSMAAMVTIVILQIIARLLHTTIPSSDDISGYMVAWTSFIGLAYTMNQNAHVRVELFVNMLNATSHYFVTLITYLIAVAMMGSFSYYVFLLVKESYVYGDFTSGHVAIPLWWVQAPYFIGILALFIAVLDRLITLLINPKSK